MFINHLKDTSCFAEKVERKVDVNQDESLTDLQVLIKYSCTCIFNFFIHFS